MKNLPASNTTHVTLNASILFAAAAVALSVIAAHLASGVNAPLPIYLVTLGLVLITTLYALFELVIQGSAIWQEPKKASDFYNSAILAGFMLALVSIAITNNSSQSLPLALAGISLCIIALISFFIIMIFGTDETLVAEAERRLKQPDRHPTDPQPPGGDIVTPPPGSMHNPSPLFLEDPLFRLPQPKTARFFAVAKGNDLLVNSDDACMISDNESRFALCDGASGSFLPRPWAALLGYEWIMNPFQQSDPTRFYQWLEEPRQRWQQWVTTKWKPQVNERNERMGEKAVSNETIRRSLRVGASATFLGLEINRQNGTWHAQALGDTCLFIFRRDQSGRPKPFISFPLDTSAQFSDRPTLLYSITTKTENSIPQVKSGQIRPGDIFLMATDALAQWLLTQFEQPDQRQTLWRGLLTMQDHHQFVQFVEQQRYQTKGGMVDDDTTLVIIPL